MTHKEAKIIAAHRGFPSVKVWMRECERAAKNFASIRKQNPERYDTLIACLHNEYSRFSHLQ